MEIQTSVLETKFGDDVNRGKVDQMPGKVLCNLQQFDLK